MQHMLAAMYRVRYDSGIESNGKESGWVRLGVVFEFAQTESWLLGFWFLAFLLLHITDELSGF